MADSGTVESSLDTVAEEIGAHTTEAFDLLGNETRLAILLVLWDASEPGPETNAVTFTTLRNRVGIRQGAQFNYHLDKLAGHFVEKTDTGYTLLHRGEKIVRTIIGHAGFDDRSFDREPIDLSCRHCGGQTAISYDDAYLYRVCTDCRGTFEGADLPEGCLEQYPLAPAAVEDRTPAEMFAVAKFQGMQAVHNKMEGICSVCSGPVDKQLDVCEDHDPDGMCEACGRAEPIRVRLTCRVCEDWAIMPVHACLLYHPDVVSFYRDHGISLRWDIDDISTVRRVKELIRAEIDLVGNDPIRIRAVFSHENDELRLTLDETLDVIEVGGAR